MTDQDDLQQDVIRIDPEALAYWLFERDYLRFNPRPTVSLPDESNREKLLTVLRTLLTVSAIALMVMSTLNTFPEFARSTPGWWGEQTPWIGGIAALLSGGAAVAGVELFIFTVAALLLGALANQDYLLRPLLALPPDQRDLNVWTVILVIAFGVGRFVLMVAAGDAMALLYTMKDRLLLDATRQQDDRTREWYATFRNTWEDRRGYWLRLARKALESGEIPAEALASGGVALLNPTVSSGPSVRSLPDGLGVTPSEKSDSEPK